MNTLYTRSRAVIGILLVILLVVCTIPARSQSDLEKALLQFSKEQVSGYVQPLSDLFGANVNSGFFHSASIPTVGLTLKIELVAMGAMVGDNQKSYVAKAPPGFNPPTFNTATVFGGTGSTVTDANTGFSYRGSDGVFNTSFFPYATPQIRVGSIFGTQAVLRYVSSDWFVSNSKYPKATLFAIGAHHSVSQYLPTIPLDLAAGVAYSSITFGDLLTIKGFTISAQASKTFVILTVYGGFAWETSSMNVKYTPSNAALPAVDIDLSGANSFRATVGVGLSLGFFELFADANFGSVTNFSGGIGVGI